MRRIHATLATALMLAGPALLGGLPAAQAQSFPRSAETPAAATQGYPRTYGSGENIMVDYGPVGQGMLVGGGRVMVSQTSGMNVDVVHAPGLCAACHRLGREPGDGLGPADHGRHVPSRPYGRRALKIRAGARRGIPASRCPHDNGSGRGGRCATCDPRTASRVGRR